MLMAAIATISAAMLSGYVAMPCRVSGVTTAPKEMGISIGRPASDAQATARIEPDRNPAGIPRKPSVMPPTAANARVSARWRNIAVRLMGAGADKVLESGRFRLNQNRTLTFRLALIFSENRFPLSGSSPGQAAMD